MEARMKKYRETSPERAKIWIEPSPKRHQNRTVPVVYYLCRNLHLEHPHFIEVPLLSPKGLYLRDVIDRLNVLRGKGMAALYSWSCKRSYKSGYVWHDLCEEDLILPAHGNEYVLKGSELLEESHSDCVPRGTSTRLHNSKQLQKRPNSLRSQEASTSVSSIVGNKTNKSTREGEFSRRIQFPSSSSTSPDSRSGRSHSFGDSMSLTEYKIFKGELVVDAATQTEEHLVSKPRETCTRGVSTDDGSLENECNAIHQNEIRDSEICREEISPPPSYSSYSSTSGRKTTTLESLIRADAKKMNSFGTLERGKNRGSSNTKLKASDLLIQLISCGFVSVKDHSFGFVPNCRPRFSHAPFFSSSMMIGEFDSLSENPRLINQRFKGKEYFSGSLLEVNLDKEVEQFKGLKRSSSYHADRNCNQSDSAKNREENDSTHSKSIFRSIKASLIKQPKVDTVGSPVSDKQRKSSSTETNCSNPTSISLSNDSNKKMEVPSLANRLDEFRTKDRLINIEERLASGARVIIQSNVLYDDSDGST